MTQTTADIAGQVRTTVEDRSTSAADELRAVQQEWVESLQAGYAVSTSQVERLFRLEQEARVWTQVQRAVNRSSDEALLGELRTWHDDAVEQLLSPTRSQSTSLVRTAQMHAEEDALKTVARDVARVIARATR